MNSISHTRIAFLAHTNSLRTLILLAALLLGAGLAMAQTTSFTYQGRLNDGNSAANGSYDFQFKLFDAATAGNQIGATNTLTGVVVTSGGFTVALDFGAGAFPGADRWLEVSVKPPNSNTFILLTSRHRVTATPYAIKSLSATTADVLSAACAGCVTDAQIGGVAASKLTGVLLPASVPDLSGSYIRNATTPQTNSNFNISGNGTLGGTLTAGTVNSLALRQELTASAPNVINGFLGTFDGMLWSGNRVRGGVVGASIGGGGDLGQTGLGGEKTNQVTDSFGTVSGGLGNRAGRDNPTVGAGFADTVGGGYINVASGGEATVSGGYQNTASELQATVGGGFRNTASSPRSIVGGGVGNQASAENATVGGGNNNIASGFAAIVPGGQNNTASGAFAAVLGGRLNTASGDMSLAAGRRAKANHSGTFVWGDSTDADFTSTGVNQFLIRAAGGVGIGLDNPSSPLTVNGVIESKAGGIQFPDGTIQTTAARGTVTGVTASSPLLSSAGPTPNISLTGVVPTANGGTGLGASGAAGNLLRSNGATWASSALQATDIPAGNANYIQNNNSATAQNASFNLNGNGTLLGRLTAGSIFVTAEINGARIIARNGFNGACGPAPVFGGQVTCNQDLAEAFRTKEQTVAGDVVTLIPNDHDKPTVRKAPRAYDDHLVGVVSTNPGLVFDEGQTHLAGANDKLITKDKTVVAVVGRVPVRYTLENGPIRVGDPLTSSATVPGAAMKAIEAGKIIGYALESSDKAAKANKDDQTNAKLLMWLQVGHYVPPASLARLRAADTKGKEVAAIKSQIEQQVQTQVKARTAHLERQIEELKAQNDARLAALEQALQQLTQQTEKQPKQ